MFDNVHYNDGIIYLPTKEMGNMKYLTYSEIGRRENLSPGGANYQVNEKRFWSRVLLHFDNHFGIVSKYVVPVIVYNCCKSTGSNFVNHCLESMASYWRLSRLGGQLSIYEEVDLLEFARKIPSGHDFKLEKREVKMDLLVGSLIPKEVLVDKIGTVYELWEYTRRGVFMRAIKGDFQEIDVRWEDLLDQFHVKTSA